MNKMHIIHLVLSACFVSCLGLFFMNPREGVLTPVDPEICTSESVTFTCSIKSPTNPRYKIGFILKNKDTNRNYVRVNQDHVKVIGKSVSKLTLYNLTSRTYVRCIYGESLTDSMETRQIGYTSTIQIYPTPTKVEQIDCIVQNYYDSMNCSWDYVTDYKLGTHPQVIFQWRIPGLSSSWYNCPDLNIKHGFCHWESTRLGDFSMKDIDIQITLKQSCGIDVISTFNVDTTKIVKPNPVLELTSTTLNSTCITVKYKTTNSQAQYPKQHRLIISSKWDERQVITFNTTYLTENETHKRTVCNLHPFTTYTFIVSIKPTGYEAGYLSETRTTEATTYSDIPSTSPAFATGGYSFNARECQHEMSNRRICVLIKPILEENENGPMKGIVLSVTKTGTGEQFDEKFTEDTTYACLSDLQCNVSYTITVKALNVNGTSENNTSLFIPAMSLGILSPEVRVEAGQGRDIYMSFTHTEQASGYMAFWCRNKNGDCAERSAVDWKYFTKTTTEGYIQIENSHFPRDFLYGISAFTESGNTGIEWQDCVYLRDANPKREPKNVVVSMGSEENSLVVTWDKLTCKSDEPYIDIYNIQYRILHHDNQKSLNVSSSMEARITISNLEYGQTYIVTVRGVTEKGHFGPESLPKSGIVATRSNCSSQQWDASATISTFKEIF